jgi:cytoskeleton protein RodZ
MSVGISARPMTSIGDRLRQERLRRGLDIGRLAEQTKINASMLEAIEADDLDKLPGSFFTRSFVRQYARALGLDEDQFEPELKRITGIEEASVPEAESGRRELEFPPPVPAASSGSGRSRHSLGALIAFVLIVAACSGIYTLWQRTRDTGQAARAEAARAPAARASEPVPQTTTPAPVTPATAPTTAPAASPAPVETTSSLPPGETAQIRIQLHAMGTAWVRVIADGRILYSGTLQQNESKAFDGKASMNLRVGDPAALEVTWNGKAVGEIGPRGQPRTVQFTPEAFKILTPAPPAPRTPNDAL